MKSRLWYSVLCPAAPPPAPPAPLAVLRSLMLLALLRLEHRLDSAQGDVRERLHLVLLTINR